ncbi:MAG: GTP 3',8-cyclase MoaA [Calditrichaeota bacterium]|nr:GTP 3',8-cyclase MoaA [Calditrichota bacterium]
MRPQHEKPTSEQPPKLIDNFGRVMNYLRLAVTDRCNLRCVYCMPEKGIDWIPREEILTYEEMYRVVRLFVEMGVTKVRLTGGEPFLRKGLMDFIAWIGELPHLKRIHVTTNGVLTAPFVPRLKEIGIGSINLSLDTLRPDRFFQIARRNAFHAVMETFHRILEYEIPLKVNMVVYEGLNEDEIVPIAQLAENHPIEVRFIEQMPFNGNGGFRHIRFSWKKILETLESAFPGMERVGDHASTATLFRVPGFRGRLGIIGGYSRVFCDSCSRIRVTPRGMMKTCLYDNGVLDLKRLMRSGASDEQIKQAIREKILDRAENGFEAEKRVRRVNADSMATIGG